MELNPCGERVVTCPDAETLSLMIRQGAEEPEFFAVLSRNDQEYMQAAGNVDEGFVLEYREGSDRTHFRSATRPMALDDVIETMRLYLRDDPRWRMEVLWHPVDIRSATEWTALPYLVLTALVLAGVPGWLAIR